MQPTLETFVPTRGSRRALAAVRTLLRDQRAGLVLLHGPAGVGKTRLLRGAGLASGTTCRAVTEIVDVILGRARRFPPGLLIVDDLHVLAGMPMSQREVARQLVQRVRAGASALAAAGDLADLPELVGALRRVEGAQFVEVQPPATQEMTRLLLVLAARSGVRLEPVAARSIAARCRGDVRLAEGEVARLRLVRSLQG